MGGADVAAVAAIWNPLIRAGVHTLTTRERDLIFMGKDLQG